MQKHYKILHIPTGLFFKPSRNLGSIRPFEDGHLSKIGKVYSKRPSWSFVSSGLKLKELKKYPQSDFIIVEFEVIERQRCHFL